MKQCPACGANNSSDAPSCSICGADLPPVADGGAARTLFGMPALKIDQIESKSKADPAWSGGKTPEPDPMSGPERVPSRSQGPATRRGFRALDAVELDGSVGSMNSPSVGGSGDDLFSTQFGSPSPFKAGQLASAGRSAPPAEPSEPAGEMRSTQFGAPSPFKAGQLPPIGTGDAPAEPEDAIASTRMGMPSIDVHGKLRAAEPAPAPAADPPAENYRTLVGPPLPVAEAARARDAARKKQEQESAVAEAAAAVDNYRTLVGPPVPIAEAARARDAARKAREAARPGPSVVVGGGEGKPSVIVDDDAIGREAEQPSVIVDEPVDLSPAARTARPPGAAEITRPSGDAERAAAARFAAAMDTGERTAMVQTVQPRRYSWIFLLLIVAGIAIALWLTRGAYAAEARVERIDVQQADGQLAITAVVRSEQPAQLNHPGGSTAVAGEAPVTFTLPLDGPSPGVTPLNLSLTAAGVTTPLPGELAVWFRAEAAPTRTAGEPVPVELAVHPGWRPVGEGIEPVPGQPDRYRLTLDPAAALAAVDGPGGLTATIERPLVLRGADGAEQRFTLTAEAPLPRTPLALTAPTHHRRRAAERITVAGRTAPGAAVALSGAGAAPVTGVADAEGLFSLTAALGEPGSHGLELTVDGPGARPTVERIAIEPRAEPAPVGADSRPAGRASNYTLWLSRSEALRGQDVAIAGVLVAVERGETGVDGRSYDHAVITTCARGDRCPVWVATRQPIPVDVGEPVALSGALAGTETWRAAAGFVTAPRVEGALRAP